MSATGSALRRAVLEPLWRFKRPDVPVAVALRNTLAVVLPIAAGFASGHVEAGIGIGAGALNVMFADRPGPYRQRLVNIGLTSVAGAVAGLIGFLFGAHTAAFVAVLAAASFAGGLLVMFGPDLARVGMIAMILMVIAASSPLAPREAALAALAILAGGLWQALLSIAAWPLQRYRPERFAVAAVYRGLAALTAPPPADHDAEPPPLTDSMNALQQTLLGRMHARGRAMEAFRVLLELAERLRLELLAVPRGDADARAIGEVLLQIATALENGDPPRAAEGAQDRWRAIATPADAALIGQLAAAVRNANWAGSRGEQRAREADAALPRALRSESPWATLRANLHPGSAAFRHAVRCAVVVGAALLLARLSGLERGYWLPMTVAIVLRPDFGATLSVGLLRIAGTLLGLLLTTVLLHLTPTSTWPDLALMAVLCFGFRYLATAHYGLAVAALTGTVVILLSFEGLDASATLVERVLNTLLGSGLALAAYLLWPTWERGRSRPLLATMLQRYADYLQALASGDDHARREQRTAARAARLNALASLERLRAEPGDSARLAPRAEAVFANGNRLARTGMQLEALLQRDATPLPAAIAAFVGDIAQNVREQAAALVAQSATAAPPELRQRQRTLAASLSSAGDPRAADLALISDRLTDNIDTLAHVVDRCAGPDRGAPV